MIVPAHELEVGQIILPYSSTTRSKVVRLPQLNMGFSYRDDAEYREVEEVEVVEQKPWIGGIPFQIIEIALPLIFTRSCLKRTDTQIPPFLFFDSNIVSFIRVSPEFTQVFINEYNSFYDASKASTALIADNLGKPISQKTILSCDDRVKASVDALCAQALKDSDILIKNAKINAPKSEDIGRSGESPETHETL